MILVIRHMNISYSCCMCVILIFQRKKYRSTADKMHIVSYYKTKACVHPQLWKDYV